MLHHSKLFGCNIHDSIRVESLALKIIDTPEFQRMRNIKQLGLCNHVYPAAIHTRFEHSIGVYHLTGRMLEKILQQYPDKEYDIPEISETKIKLTGDLVECIKIAGLCHDIGHGPFSHVFDNILLKKINHENKEHENRSMLITEILCKRTLSDVLTDKHIAFIKSIINPDKHHRGVLYQIVSNSMNGIDVDKFDYLIRDSKNLGLYIGFNPNRLINEFIIDQNDNIAYPKHCSSDIYEMFHSRYMLHKKVYCHKTVKILEVMLSDIFVIVDKVFKVSETIHNMSEFCTLTDDTIFNYIQLVTNPLPFFKIVINEPFLTELYEAYNIYQQMISRKLYRQITEEIDNLDAEAHFKKFIAYFLKKFPVLNESDFQIIKSKIGFMSENKPDPFESIYFYNKKEDTKTFITGKKQITGLMQNESAETHCHLICKKRAMYQIVISEYNEYNKQYFTE